MHQLRAAFTVLVLTFLFSHAAFSDKTNLGRYATYKDGILNIPRVDTDEQAGNYQEVTFQYDSEINAWKLLTFRDTTIVPGEGIVPESVEPIIIDATLIQVLLKVSGKFPNGCGQFGQINQRVIDNRFEITMHLAPVPDDAVCTDALVPYERTIPLQVYGLNEGTYEYEVNGGNKGSFTLTRNNFLPGK